MTEEQAWLDRLICDIVKGKQETNGNNPVSVEDILAEVKNNSDAQEEEILHWIAICERKMLIQKVRPSGYAATDLDAVARKLGIADLFKS